MSCGLYQVIMTLELSSFYSTIIWQSIVFKYLALEYLKSFITVSPKERKKRLHFIKITEKIASKLLYLITIPVAYNYDFILTPNNCGNKYYFIGKCRIACITYV